MQWFLLYTMVVTFFFNYFAGLAFFLVHRSATFDGFLLTHHIYILPLLLTWQYYSIQMSILTCNIIFHFYFVHFFNTLTAPWSHYFAYVLIHVKCTSTFCISVLYGVVMKRILIIIKKYCAGSWFYYDSIHCALKVNMQE